jgi:hypothetical protein
MIVYMTRYDHVHDPLHTQHLSYQRLEVQNKMRTAMVGVNNRLPRLKISNQHSST